jgi:hypothetical protein
MVLHVLHLSVGNASLDVAIMPFVVIQKYVLVLVPQDVQVSKAKSYFVFYTIITSLHHPT